jgi:APA family basic amino acid/polyamine antiporter
LRRELGLREVTAGGVGIIIGAGIYVLVGAATELAGATVWIAFLLAAGLSALTALSYAELTSMYPAASAEYEYTRQAFPGWVAFIIGCAMIAGMVIASAAVSIGFARYLAVFVDVPGPAAALFLIAVTGLLAVGGIKQSARVTLLLSSVQIGGLVLIVLIGLPHVGQQNLLEAPGGFGGILGAAALIFFAFIGFDEINTLAEETKEPTRTIPRALLLALTISAGLYLLVAIAAVSVVGPDKLGASSRPLTDVMAHDLGHAAGAIVAVIALVSTTNTTLLAITASSRLLYGMAAQGALPGWLSAIHPRWRTPVRAIAVTAVISAGAVFLGDVALIAAITDFAIYVVFLAVNATVVLLRFQRPDLLRPFRVPGSLGKVPVLPILGFLAVTVMLTQLDLRATVAGVVMCLVLFVVALLRRPERTGSTTRTGRDADNSRTGRMRGVNALRRS